MDRKNLTIRSKIKKKEFQNVERMVYFHKVRSNLPMNKLSKSCIDFASRSYDDVVNQRIDPFTILVEKLSAKCVVAHIEDERKCKSCHVRYLSIDRNTRYVSIDRLIFQSNLNNCCLFSPFCLDYEKSVGHLANCPIYFASSPRFYACLRSASRLIDSRLELFEV